MTVRALRSACPLGALILSGIVLLTAQAGAVPAPIPAPPIPAPPQLGPVPKLELGPTTPVARPDIEMPDPPALDRIAIPPAAAITQAAKNDPVPPPPSGAETPRPPTVSPGATNSQVEEMLFAVDPGGSQIPASAEAKLKLIAQDMAQAPAARLEIRTFSPTRAHSESTARRLSLARFLAVRDSLKRYGVSEGRVDGRPLTSEPGEANADRVELYLER